MINSKRRLLPPSPRRSPHISSCASLLRIDTAAVYRNEAQVGKVLSDHMASGSMTREDLFLTTKLAPADHGYEEAKRAVDHSIAQLGVDYLDLYLIHWPGKGGLSPDSPVHAPTRRETWRALEEKVREGKIRHIGVSNYTVRHLQEMKEYATIQPAVNQVEFHPRLYQKELLEYCNANRIVLQAYSPLGRGELISEPSVVSISARLNRTPAEVLLRWCLQHGLALAVKSATPSRIDEFLRAHEFELTAEDVAALDSLSDNHHYCWDPTFLA